MSGTYRRVLAWEHDGVTRYGNGRKSMAKNKPIARRIERREHARIIREAAWQHENDINFERQEAIHEALDAEWYDDDPMDYLDWYERNNINMMGDDYPLSYEDDHPGYDDYYDPYDDLCPWDEVHISQPLYEAGYLSKEGLTRLDLNARIKVEDAGLSLGDILSDILKKQMEQD